MFAWASICQCRNAAWQRLLGENVGNAGLRTVWDGLQKRARSKPD
ncbi:hypothetical protein RBSH_04345 [Rhodopirellula baltica SH28]|uniref:Uncharacterized protein n=1 Tax=Rhodopirellula baltica SH28 TaxID=993517 RepID=K5DBY6_RHOBT|nr:hypothetical protein RBSH_04345 [Rhodopirellula baltica SH28]